MNLSRVTLCDYHQHEPNGPVNRPLAPSLQGVEPNFLVFWTEEPCLAIANHNQMNTMDRPLGPTRGLGSQVNQ